MPLPALSRKDARKLTRLLAQPRACLLCHTFPAAYNVIFQPDHPELWGGTRGKDRLIGYALCASCYAVPDVTMRVEARMQADLGARRN